MPEKKALVERLFVQSTSMSRIGKRTTEIPNGVTVEVKDGMIVVKGPKGELSRPTNDLVQIAIENNVVTVAVANENVKKERSLWGTYSSHIANMVLGVTEGFQKQLEVNERKIRSKG